MRTVRKIAVGALAVMLVIGAAPGLRAEEDTTGWRDEAELSYVMTAGNSESSTFGFKNKLWKEMERSLLEFSMGALRVETTTTTIENQGTEAAPVFDETEIDETTAEAYFFNGRYNRKITDRFFWYTGAGWERNRFAGIDDRYSAQAGVGNIWYDTDDVKFRTDYAVTYTDQEDVFVVPGMDDTFLGLRFSWAYSNQLTGNTVYTNDFIADYNVDESDDWRGDMFNSVAVAMSERLALKLSLRLLYDNAPSFEEAPAADPILFPLAEPAPYELDELDTIFTASLVVSF